MFPLVVQVGTLEASKLSVIANECSLLVPSQFICLCSHRACGTGALALAPGGDSSKAHLEKIQERALGKEIRKRTSVASLRALAVITSCRLGKYMTTESTRKTDICWEL